MIRSIILLLFLALMGCSSLDLDSLLTNRRPRNYLRDDVYKYLQVEIIEVEGLGPTLADLDFFEARLKQYCNKTDIFVSRFPRIVPRSELPANPVWDAAAARAFRDKYATHKTHDEWLTMYALFVPGTDADDEGALRAGAAAFDSDLFIIYSEQWTYSSAGSVMLHEMGHLLGLVDNGTPRQSDHEEHDSHCNNNQCAMYWLQVANPRPDYDAACKADLKANGSK